MTGSIRASPALPQTAHRGVLHSGLPFRQLTMRYIFHYLAHKGMSGAGRRELEGVLGCKYNDPTLRSILEEMVASRWIARRLATELKHKPVIYYAPQHWWQRVCNRESSASQSEIKADNLFKCRVCGFPLVGGEQIKGSGCCDPCDKAWNVIAKAVLNREPMDDDESAIVREVRLITSRFIRQMSALDANSSGEYKGNIS